MRARASGSSSHAGQILDEQVTPSEQTSKRLSDLVILAEQDTADLLDDALELLPHTFSVH